MDFTTFMLSFALIESWVGVVHPSFVPVGIAIVIVSWVTEKETFADYVFFR
jgi:hypothetical protein